MVSRKRLHRLRLGSKVRICMYVYDRITRGKKGWFFVRGWDFGVGQMGFVVRECVWLRYGL